MILIYPFLVALAENNFKVYPYFAENKTLN